MPDYIELFCGMIERGHDMADMDWYVWQDIAAEILFTHQPDELDGVIIQ